MAQRPIGQHDVRPTPVIRPHPRRRIDLLHVHGIGWPTFRNGNTLIVIPVDLKLVCMGYFVHGNNPLGVPKFGKLRAMPGKAGCRGYTVTGAFVSSHKFKIGTTLWFRGEIGARGHMPDPGAPGISWEAVSVRMVR